MDESSGKAAFNMALAFLERLNNMLKEADEFSKHGELAGWNATLKTLYRNLHGIVNREEREKVNKIMLGLNEFTENDFNGKGINPRRELLNRSLSELDLELKDLIWKHKLMMPDQNDPRFAIGRFGG